MAGIDLSQKKKVAFVCSGGAVKAAAFHVGVALALEHHGFYFSGGTRQSSDIDGPRNPSKSITTYVGSSAGSLVGTYLAQGGKLRDIMSSFLNSPTEEGIPGMKYWEMLYPRVRSKRQFFSFDNFLMSMIKSRSVQSPFSTHGVANYLKNHVIKTDSFSELEADLFIVATEVNQSKKVIFGKYKSAPSMPFLEYRNDVSISDSCAASMALPPIYHPYSIQIDGEKRDYFDGEIREPLSSHVAREVGCDLIICSYTHQPIRIPANKQSLAEKGVQEVTLQAIYQSIEQKIQSARGTRSREKALLDQVSRFFDENELSAKLKDRLVEELESRMTHKSNVDYVYIRPRPSDHETFLLPHFSLNRAKTERIVKKGFLAAVHSVRSFGLGKT